MQAVTSLTLSSGANFAFFANIPHEIIVRIFFNIVHPNPEHLFPCFSVSRTFRQIAFDKYILQRICQNLNFPIPNDHQHLQHIALKFVALCYRGKTSKGLVKLGKYLWNGKYVLKNALLAEDWFILALKKNSSLATVFRIEDAKQLEFLPVKNWLKLCRKKGLNLEQIDKKIHLLYKKHRIFETKNSSHQINTISGQEIHLSLTNGRRRSETVLSSFGYIEVVKMSAPNKRRIIKPKEGMTTTKWYHALFKSIYYGLGNEPLYEKELTYKKLLSIYQSKVEKNISNSILKALTAGARININEAQVKIWPIIKKIKKQIFFFKDYYVNLTIHPHCCQTWKAKILFLKSGSVVVVQYLPMSISLATGTRLNEIRNMEIMRFRFRTATRIAPDGKINKTFLSLHHINLLKNFVDSDNRVKLKKNMCMIQLEILNSLCSFKSNKTYELESGSIVKTYRIKTPIASANLAQTS